MLIKHPILDGKLVHAWKEPAYRLIPSTEFRLVDVKEPTKYNFIVDEQENICGAVTEKHKLVLNSELISALDIVTDKLGIELNPIRAVYHKGKSIYTFEMPKLIMQPGNDPSKTTGMIDIKNYYGGNGGIQVSTGFFRLVCTNGLRIGKTWMIKTQRHIGEFNLPDLLEPILLRTIERFEKNKMLAEQLVKVNTPYTPNEWLTIANGQNREPEIWREWENPVSDILENTPPRYRNDLYNTILRYAGNGIGNNAWSVAQAVAEISTHTMQNRKRFNMNADKWATKQLDTLIEYANMR